MYKVQITFSAMEDLARLPAAKHTQFLRRINTILTAKPIPKGHRKKPARYRLKLGKLHVLYTVREKDVTIVAIH